MDDNAINETIVIDDDSGDEEDFGNYKRWIRQRIVLESSTLFVTLISIYRVVHTNRISIHYIDINPTHCCCYAYISSDISVIKALRLPFNLSIPGYDQSPTQTPVNFPQPFCKTPSGTIFEIASLPDRVHAFVSVSPLVAGS